MSFLNQHFCRFMDAYKDGMLTKVRCEDISFPLPPKDEGRAAAVYCIVNDLDVGHAPELLDSWHKLRTTEPPPIPSNVLLGAD